MIQCVTQIFRDFLGGLEVINEKIPLLSASPTCALNGTRGRKGDGGAKKVNEVYPMVSKYLSSVCTLNFCLVLFPLH